MDKIRNEQLRNIYNYFAFEQSRLFSGFIESRLPGCADCLKILQGQKLLKKTTSLGGYYYTSTDIFEDRMAQELERRERVNDMPTL